jgi:hypothetical protein
MPNKANLSSRAKSRATLLPRVFRGRGTQRGICFFFAVRNYGEVK